MDQVTQESLFKGSTKKLSQKWKVFLATGLLVLPSLLFFLVVSHSILNPPVGEDYPSVWPEFIGYIWITLVCVSWGYPILKKEEEKRDNERIEKLLKEWLQNHSKEL